MLKGRTTIRKLPAEVSSPHPFHTLWTTGSRTCVSTIQQTRFACPTLFREEHQFWSSSMHYERTPRYDTCHLWVSLPSSNWWKHMEGYVTKLSKAYIHHTLIKISAQRKNGICTILEFSRVMICCLSSFLLNFKIHSSLASNLTANTLGQPFSNLSKHQSPRRVVIMQIFGSHP